jgi:hypothetical protein
MMPEGFKKKVERKPEAPESVRSIDILKKVRDGLRLKGVLEGLDKNNKPDDKSSGVEIES